MRRLLLILAVASVPALAQSADETGVATPAPAQPPPAPSSQKWFPDAGASRSLFAPTGFTLRHGERLLKVEGIYLAFELGLFDHFSVELGTLYPSWLLGGINGVVGVKWGTDLNEQTHVAVSALAGSSVANFTYGWMGLGTVTYGSPDANMTFSAGPALLSMNTGPDPKVSPVAEVALYYRLMQNLALETEHWFIYTPGLSSSFVTLHGAGIRLMFESVAIHAGAMSTYTIWPAPLPSPAPGQGPGNPSFWPWVGLTWLTGS